VTIADYVDLVVGVAILVFILVELESESIVKKIQFHCCGREGNAGKRREKVVGGSLPAT
jgi:hypothetical protein